MATIEEDYVSFETAKLLKEKGFDGECRAAYTNYGKLFTTQIQQYITNVLCSKGILWDCTAPTLQRAVRWLREVHHWHIFVIPKWENVEYMPGEWEEKMVGYQYVIMDVGEVTRKNGHLTTTALSPESACEAGIKYCLEHLI